MARYMNKDGSDSVFRAVIIRHYPETKKSDGPYSWDRAAFTSTEIMGPYTSKGPASQALGKAKKDNAASNSRFPNRPPVVIDPDSRVEEGTVTWTPVK